jgi:carboxyl-terminal processing protease
MTKQIRLPKVNISLLRKIFIYALLGCLIFASGVYAGRNFLSVRSNGLSGIKIERVQPDSKKDIDFSLFWRVWDSLEANYFDRSKLNAQNMVYGAIKGMVEAVGDPYTVFLSPNENKVTEEDLQGSFQGVGIQIGYKGTQLAVIAPLPQSPAEKAGVKAGDFIIGIKDEKKGIDRGTVGISLPDAVSAIRGPAGSTVTLVLSRDGIDKAVVVDIVRQDISVPSVVVDYLGDNKEIAHLSLLKFAGDTEKEWDNAVRDILKSAAKGIVLDLRNNPGGYLQSAVDIAGDFLSNGTVVVVQEDSSGQKSEYKTSRLPRLNDYRLVVLVNGGSASASEILAAALRDQAKVKLVGDKTFGKGTIQEPKQLEGGAGLHITVAKWLSPSGEWVNGNGLSPNVEVKDNAETSEDEQLAKAREILDNLK